MLIELMIVVAVVAIPVDTNFDGYVDVIYAADTRGNLWRINTSDPGSGGAGLAPASWTTQRIAHVSDRSKPTERRKFLYGPDVVTIGSVNTVMIGTGDREHPLDLSPAATVLNRFYAFRDEFRATRPAGIKGTDCDARGDETLDATCDLLNITDLRYKYSGVGLARGWVLELNTATSEATDRTKEQVITTPTTIGGVTFFSTFQPTDTSKIQACGNLGTARGYAVSFLTGGLAPTHSVRASEFTGGGLLPSPVSGLVSVSGKLVPFVLGGKPAEIKDDRGNPVVQKKSALEGNTVPISIQPIRKKIYRYNRIDSK